MSTCPKCGAAEILEGVRIEPVGGGAQEVRATVAPTSGMVRKTTGSKLRAWICGECGFTELYVEEPATLAERWRAGDR